LKDTKQDETKKYCQLNYKSYTGRMLNYTFLCFKSYDFLFSTLNRTEKDGSGNEVRRNTGRSKKRNFIVDADVKKRLIGKTLTV
jgi:hypothetical protein